jgi:hypothetical protein
MSKETGHNPPQNKPRTQASIREDRLKAALKANMGRRKAQTRARKAQPQADNSPDGAQEESS